MKKYVLSILLCVAMVLGLTACQRSNAPDSQTGSGTDSQEKSQGNNETSGENESSEAADIASAGGVLKVGIMAEIVVLGYPGRLVSSNELVIVQPAVETLCRFDSEGKLVPWLCESFAEDADNLTVTVKLKEGIKFHDGTDFNAEAVKWNWEEFIAQGRNELASLDFIEAVDEYTVVAHLKNWDNAFSENALYQAGFMFSPSFCKEKGVDEAGAHPVGTGPYKFSNWEKDIKVIFEKNEDYWIEGQPYLDGIEIYLMFDNNTMATTYLTGGFDALPILMPDARSLLLAQDQEGLLSEAVLGGATITIMAYGCTDSNSPFTDINLRKAVSHAIDYAAIANAINSGTGYILTNQWAMPGAWSYNDSTEGYPYDPEKSREYLAAAGKPDGFEFTCYTMTINNTLAEMIQGYLNDVGINMSIENIDQAKQDEIAGIGGNWDGMILSAGRCDAEIASIYARTFTSEGVRFVGGMLHPEDVADLISKARNAKTFDEKAQHNRELADLVSSYNMIQPMFINVPVWFCKDNVQDTGFYKTHIILWTPETAKFR